jgi:hypothetical protein
VPAPSFMWWLWPFLHQQREGASLKFSPQVDDHSFYCLKSKQNNIAVSLSSAVHIEKTCEVQWDAKPTSLPFSHYWLLGNSLSNCIYGETGSNSSLELPTWNCIGNGKRQEQENNTGSIKAWGKIKDEIRKSA